MSADYGLNLTSFPGASTLPLSPSELVTNVLFVPIARRLGSVPGVLLDNVVFGGFKVAWNVRFFCSFRLDYCIKFGCNQTYDFILYTARVLLLLSYDSYLSTTYSLTVANRPQFKCPAFYFARRAWRCCARIHSRCWYLARTATWWNLGI